MWNSYEKFKAVVSNNVPRIKVVGLLVLMFFVGFGAGKFEHRDHKSYEDYSISEASAKTKVSKEETPTTTTQQAITVPKQQVGGAAASAEQTGCKVKGNISSSKEKIYHVEGGMFYERTKPEECFDSEEAAISAGYRKSSR